MAPAAAGDIMILLYWYIKSLYNMKGCTRARGAITIISIEVMHILQASNHNSAGEYESATQCGQMALCCNICVIIKYVLMFVAAVVIVVLFFTGVLVFTSSSEYCYPRCTTDIYGDVTCRQVCTYT